MFGCATPVVHSGRGRGYITALFAMICACVMFAAGPQRPHDPWVFRCVLDENPRAVVIALHENLWAAYDASNGGLMRLWRDGVAFTGTVYDTRHGPQPRSKGEPIMPGPDGSVWRVRMAGREIEPTFTWRGYRFENDRVSLQYELQLPGEGLIHIEERPEIDEAETDRPALQRTFTMRGAPSGTNVRLVIFDGNPDVYRALNVASTAGLTHDHRPGDDETDARLIVTANLTRNAETIITIND